MSTERKMLGEKKWFVPLIIILFIALLSSSLFNESEEKIEYNEEKALEELCNSIYGIENTKVMITYETVSISTFASGQSTKKINGIAVVCNGGSNPKLVLQLHEMIKSLYDIPSTRISVSEGNYTPGHNFENK